MLCPCQSQKSFEECCQPFIEKQALPETAEQLMRSRYSAYATDNAQYIVDTYSKKTREKNTLADIQAWMKECRWLNLIIHQHSINPLTATQAEVEFSAYFIHNKQLCLMRENSRFERIAQQWYYIDGNIIENTAFEKIKRNEPCPCQQGKKFKQCCGRFVT